MGVGERTRRRSQVSGFGESEPNFWEQQGGTYVMGDVRKIGIGERIVALL